MERSQAQVGTASTRASGLPSFFALQQQQRSQRLSLGPPAVYAEEHVSDPTTLSRSHSPAFFSSRDSSSGTGAVRATHSSAVLSSSESVRSGGGGGGSSVKSASGSPWGGRLLPGQMDGGRDAVVVVGSNPMHLPPASRRRTVSATVAPPPVWGSAGINSNSLRNRALSAAVPASEWGAESPTAFRHNNPMLGPSVAPGGHPSVQTQRVAGGVPSAAMPHDRPPRPVSSSVII